MNIKHRVSIGDTFGNWIILDNIRKYKKKNSKARVSCICKCGKINEVILHDLISSKNTRCNDCKIKEIALQNNDRIIPTVLYSLWKSGAKYRGLHFDVTHEFLEKLFIDQNYKCALSGILLKCSRFKVKDLNSKYSLFDFSKNVISLDRINSDKAYTEDNVQIVHKRVNTSKLDLSDEEFIRMANHIAKTHPRNIETEPFEYTKKCPALVKAAQSKKLKAA